MSTHWILIFAYHFPPENTVGAARPFRFYKFLPEHGFRCHVITAADVHTVPSLQAEQVPDTFSIGSRKSLSWHAERAVRKFLLPGAIGTQWAFKAAAAASRFIDAHPGDRFTIFSTFPPVGSHLAALFLLRKKNLPWVADFRDPLRDNPAYRRLSKTAHRVVAWLEKQCLRKASAVVANTDEAARLLRNRYPERQDSIHLIWNGFDPEGRISALQTESGEVRHLSHIGELYEGRTVRPIVESIARLRNAGHAEALGTQIKLVGPVEADCLPPAETVTAAEQNGWLSITPHQVPKSEAQRLGQITDMLLLVQPQSAVQVPGKVFEYLQIGRPILAYVPRESAIERILEKAGIPFRCLYTDQSAAAIDQGLLEFLRLPSDPAAPSQWFEDTFNARSQTAALAEIIKRTS